MNTNPNQAPYLHLDDYRKMVPGNTSTGRIPKNPKTRYRPSSWTVKPSRAYNKSSHWDLAEDQMPRTQQEDRDYWTFVAQELQAGLLPL